jgi:tRNA nucleotidyltransferase (CCA-adding enzyme)
VTTKNIRLTTEERTIFDLLMDVVRARTPSTTVRVVGGWTRDKLMGVQPKDIDIMVDNMTGPDFARLVTSHFGLKDPHTIKDNPEKSKHVETAKMRLPVDGGVRELDVAMCRKEVYNEKSRIPSDVRMATPEEDATRRDLTVNALFYNIATGYVEDFTGHGLEDLEKKVLRAPGNPVIRFMEDPLRIFRIARFAARYGWEVEPATMAAMGDPEVTRMLNVKTAPERIGEEMEKIMKEPYSDKGLEILHQHGIIEGMIGKALTGTEYEGMMSPFNMDQRSTHHDLTVWDHSLAAVRNMMRKYPVEDPDRRLVALLAALGHDLGKLFTGIQAVTEDGNSSYHGHEDHSGEIVRRLLKHIKLDKVAPEVASIASMHMRPYALVDASPKAIRKFLRQLAEAGVRWIDVINMVMSDVTAKSQMGDTARATLNDLTLLKSRIEAVESEMSGLGVVQTKPLLNGGDIMGAFGNRKPGPWIGTVQEFVKDLVDTNPAVTKEEAIRKSLDQFPEFVMSPVKSTS